MPGNASSEYLEDKVSMKDCNSGKESFSGYYSKVGNVIANAFVSRCLAVGKAGDLNESL